MSKRVRSRKISKRIGVKVAPKKRKPRTTQTGTSIRVRNEEMINTYNRTVDFEVNRIAINPGDPTTFPWLCGIAGRYETYIFNKLEFFTVSHSPHTYDGIQILALDFDPSDEPPNSEQQIMSYEGAVMAKIFDEVVLTCSHVSLQSRKRFFVRLGDSVIYANMDSEHLRTMDVGNLFISVTGSSGIENQVTLFVRYDITFFTPQMELQLQGTGIADFPDGTTADQLTQDSYDPLVPAIGTVEESKLAIIPTDGNSFILPRVGDFLVSLVLTGTGATNPGALTAAGTRNIVTEFTGNMALADATMVMRDYFVKNIDPEEGYDLGNAVATTITNFQIIVTTVASFMEDMAMG